jgi:hypothetical protein
LYKTIFFKNRHKRSITDPTFISNYIVSFYS